MVWLRVVMVSKVGVRVGLRFGRVSGLGTGGELGW